MNGTMHLCEHNPPDLHWQSTVHTLGHAPLGQRQRPFYTVVTVNCTRALRSRTSPGSADSVGGDADGPARQSAFSTRMSLCWTAAASSLAPHAQLADTQETALRAAELGGRCVAVRAAPLATCTLRAWLCRRARANRSRMNAFGERNSDRDERSEPDEHCADASAVEPRKRRPQEMR